MRTTYNITITSRSLYFSVLLISILIGTIGSTYLLSVSGNKLGLAFYCLIDLIVVFFLIYLLNPLSKKKAIITIDKKFLIINLPSFIYKGNNRVVEIAWDELDNFLIEPNHLTRVKFKLKDGKKILFFYDGADSKRDEYLAFEMALYKKIIEINKERQSNGIERAKTIYESLLNWFNSSEG